MPQRSFSSIASTLATTILVICAVLSSVVLIRRELGASPNGAPPKQGFTKQPNWAEYNNERLRIGPQEAKVKVVAFSDFQCPACKLFAQRLSTARQKYGDQVAIIFRHLPLTIHAEAEPAAVASECAALDGRFAEMHDVLFAKQDSLGSKPWESFAREAAIGDIPAFNRCLSQPDVRARVSADADAARALGADRTPTVLIDGVRFSGAIPQRSLDSLIDNALSRAR